MAAAALRAAPLDAATFRAYGSGRHDDHDDVSECFTRLCKLLARSLSGLCATPPNFSLERAETVDAAMPAAAEGDGVRGLLQQADGDAFVRVSLDKPLVFSLCDLLLGGVGNEAPYAEQRPLSHIERELGLHLVSLIGEVLPQAFAGGPPEPFSLWKPKEDAGDEQPVFKPSLQLTILATVMSYSGEIRIELPPALAALARQAAAPAAGPAAGAARAASGWSEQIATRLQPSELDVNAVLVSFKMTLADLGKLQPGQLIRLPASFAKPVTLESDGIVLHRARLGQQARRFCLSILQPEDRKE